MAQDNPAIRRAIFLDEMFLMKLDVQIKLATW
jgi:hypothetical protein